jgi:hypothetical protein
MAGTRLTRNSQTFAIAYENAFANPAAPTTTEFNNANFVFLVSCALTEDGTSMTLGDSDADSTITFCSIGNEQTPTNANPTAQFTWLKDANTGGSGTTVDLTSLYNKVTGLIDLPDSRYWIISRTGKQGSQDAAFAVTDRIKMGLFSTDYATDLIENGKPLRGQQSFNYAGGLNWNYKVAS